MTAAGVASLSIVHDFLTQGNPASVDSTSPALVRALGWMNDGDNVMHLHQDVYHYDSYALYGIARAGLASGYKYFGKHDWYTELATPQLARQTSDGSFGDPIDTSFVLLFLARGRHPIIYNKLILDGRVLYHPRDTANLARFATRELEHTFNAQVVPLDVDWRTWTESPVLYLAAATPPVVTDAECDQLRNFVRSGGLLFTPCERKFAVVQRLRGATCATAVS